MTIDLNCDMGELTDAALEAALMEYVTSANIACGGHAGNDETMERTARLALAHGVKIGAHPGYPDPANFGRVEMNLTPEEIAATVELQLRRLDAIVGRLGGTIVHVKPHGALYNQAVRDPEVAWAIGVGTSHWNPHVLLVGLAGSAMVESWKELGFNAIGEAFADRRYEADGTLRPRKFADALITDPAAAAEQVVLLARLGTAGTICVHGDTPGAVAILKACREALTYET